MQKQNFSYAVSKLESTPFTASSEFFGTQYDLDSGLQNQPEKRLILAVLLDAVECFQNYMAVDRRKPDRLFRSTEEWIFEDDHKWPFSFLNICEAVGIDANYLRNGLQQWHESRFRKDSGLKKTLPPIKMRRFAWDLTDFVQTLLHRGHEPLRIRSRVVLATIIFLVFFYFTTIAMSIMYALDLAMLRFWSNRERLDAKEQSILLESSNAQDFFAAFGNDGVGKIGTETTINSGDIAGILMIAVQALENRTAELKEKEAQIAALAARLEALESRQNQPVQLTAAK